MKDVKQQSDEKNKNVNNESVEASGSPATMMFNRMCNTRNQFT
jgi:hypothetical protein